MSERLDRPSPGGSPNSDQSADAGLCGTIVTTESRPRTSKPHSKSLNPSARCVSGRIPRSVVGSGSFTLGRARDSVSECSQRSQLSSPQRERPLVWCFRLSSETVKKPGWRGHWPHLLLLSRDRLPNFTAARVRLMLEPLAKHAKESGKQQHRQLETLNRELAAVTRGMERLYEGIEKGVIKLDDTLSERTAALQAQRQAILTSPGSRPRPRCRPTSCRRSTSTCSPSCYAGSSWRTGHSPRNTCACWCVRSASTKAKCKSPAATPRWRKR